MTCCPIVELRQYTLHPGRRDTLVELFEREFVETQEAAGIRVLGQFRDLDRPDRFVWLRGFADMPSRAIALDAFYRGPVWQQHRDAANATMIDSDNVLLLRAIDGFDLTGARTSPQHVAVIIDGFDREPPADPARLTPPGGRMLARLVTEPSINTYPRLPVREGEHILVEVLAFSDRAAQARFLDELVPHGGCSREVLRLEPTARSLIGYG